MKNTSIVLGILAISASLSAQTITVTPISKLAYCVGDSVLTTYQASGSFSADNHFYAELSDSSGSFGSFTSSALQLSKANGSIPIQIAARGTRYRVRIASTDPYMVSNDNGSDISCSTINFQGTFSDAPHQQQVYQQLLPGGTFAHTRPVALGFDGETITLESPYWGGTKDTSLTFSWQFSPDATVDTTDPHAPKVIHSTSGIKYATLVNSNTGGCSIEWPFWYSVMDCKPTIPKNAHVVTGTESGSDSIVWIKGGGNYEIDCNSSHSLIFVEPGGVLTALNASGECYVKAGGSVVRSQKAQNLTELTAILTPGVTISRSNSNVYDTFYCSTLDFDYSQVQSGVAEVPSTPLSLHQSGNYLFANDEGLPIEIRISNILGEEVLSQRGTGVEDVDLSALPVGVYFAVIEAGNDRAVKRIAVVH